MLFEDSCNALLAVQWTLHDMKSGIYGSFSLVGNGIQSAPNITVPSSYPQPKPDSMASSGDILNILGFAISIIGLSTIYAFLLDILRSWTPSYAFKQLENILLNTKELLGQHLENGLPIDTVRRFELYVFIHLSNKFTFNFLSF